MDADGRIIPIVEDDQGEGFKDPLTLDDILQLQFNETIQEHQKEMFRQMWDNVYAPKKEEFKRPGQAPEARWAPPKDFNRRK